MKINRFYPKLEHFNLKKILFVLSVAYLCLTLQAHIAFAIDLGSYQIDLEVGSTYDSYLENDPQLVGDNVLVSWSQTTDSWTTYSSRNILVDTNGVLGSNLTPTITPRTNDSSDTIIYNGLSNGNILVCWYSGSSGKDFTDTYFKIINQNGVEVVQATKINSEAGSLNRFTKFAELSNGYLAFVWATDGSNYAMRRFSVSGSTATAVDASQLSLTSIAGLSGSQYTHEIAANNDGQFMITMSQYDYYYRGMIFNNTSSSPIQVGGQNAFVISNRGEYDNNITVKLLSNGKFLTVYRKIPTSGTSNRSTAFRIYNADGTPVGDETIVRRIDSWGWIDKPIIVDGGFLLSYYFNDGASQYYLEHYGNNGTLIDNITVGIPAITDQYGYAIPFRDYDDTVSFLTYDSSDGGSNYDVFLLRSPVSADTEITSFDAIGDVAGGTTVSATYADAAAVISALPSSVTANASAVSVPVTTWVDTDSYDAGTAGSYTFTASLGAIPSGYANTGSYTATVEVVISNEEITGFDAIGDVSGGTAVSATYADAAAVISALPSSVTANASAVTVPVTTWVDTDSYDAGTAGSYTFTASLGAIPSGYANTGSYTATVEVVISNEEITSFDAIGDVAGGTAVSATYADAAAVISALPSSVTANASAVSVPVTTWVDTDSYDAGTAGSYTFTASLGAIPSGYANTGSYTATVEVVITNEEITGFDAIGNVAGGTTVSATYADAAAVISALPSSVTANASAVSVPVTTWVDTDSYDAGTAGSYTFTATLGAIPSGYTNTGSYTATVEVVITNEEITGFDAIGNVSGGTTVSATYADAAAVMSALPSSVTANASAVTVPVTTWVDTDSYDAGTAGSYTFTATLGAIPSGYANTGSYTATVEVVITNEEITSFDAIGDVSGGTAVSATYADAAAVISALPSSVTANASAVSVPVTTWVDTDSYDAGTAGSYTFTATLGAIPSGYANTGSYTATVEVVITNEEITGFDAIGNVAGGTTVSATYADAAAVISALPSSVTANASAVSVPVTTWVDTDSYDAGTAGSYTFTATLGAIPSGYANTGSYTATVEVVISNEEITGFDAIGDVAGGTAVSATYADAAAVISALPSSVTANASAVSVPVTTWVDTDSYDAGTAGSYTFTASLGAIPSGYANTGSYTATVEVVITNEEITSFDAIGDVAGGTAVSATYADAAAVISALPSSVTANASAVTVPVTTWVDTDSYDAGTAGSYTFTASLGAIPSGYANTGSYTATVEVVISNEEITGFDAIGDVAGGTAVSATYADAAAVISALPSSVTANASAVSVPVTTWVDTDSYDAGTAGSYTFTASLGAIPSGYANTGSYTATVEVVISNEEITGFDAIGDVAGGTAVSATYADAAAVISALPSSVTANASAVSVPVTTWVDTDSYDAGTAGSYTFTASLGAIPSGYANTGSYTATVEVVISNEEITGFDAIGDVAGGTAVSATYADAAAVISALPSSVTAKTTTSSSENILVTTWLDTDSYDATTAGSYTFTASLGAIPSGYANTGGYTATVEVVITAPLDLEITSFTAIPDVSAGSAGSAIYADAAAVISALPSSVTAKTTTSSSVNILVTTWLDTDSYDATTAGSYTFTATLGAIPSGYANTGSYTTTVEVVISSPTDIQITSFTAIPDVSAGPAGSARYADEAAVIEALPSSVTAKTTTSSSISVFVTTWVDTDSYDATTAGSYTFTAILGAIPSGYANTGSHTATVEVIVMNAASDDATLKASSTIKGQIVTHFGTPSTTLGTETAGEVTITTAKASNTSNIDGFVTQFDKNNTHATVKVVKYASGASAANFANDTAYANQAITNGDFFIIKVTAEDKTSVNYYRINVIVKEVSSGGANNSTKVVQANQDTVVIVNGSIQSAGKETQIIEDGKSTVTVEIENKVIESKINEAIKENTTGKENIIQVAIADTKSEISKVELTGDILKKLEENAFNVSIKRNNVAYNIPAEEFSISKVAENLDVAESELKDIKVEVKIIRLDDKVVEKYNEVAKANGAELVFTPVEFEIVAKTTKTDGTVREQNISKFSNYVERVMEIPADIDPSKITTGIVFNADGSYNHVPTETYQQDGKWYAKLSSLTNSNYSVIFNPVTVKSVENHWAKDAVNDMASRLIIFNPENFNPDKAITRADFAAYIVRALGIYREDAFYENTFKDINSKVERMNAILTANAYGIVSGYSDGTFRGENPITREEAMTMYQKAMEIARLEGTDESRYQSYTDYETVGNWATPYVREVLSAHVFNGTTATTISPKSNLTYAEAAQAIKNLLVESALINK